MLNQILGAHGLYSNNFINSVVIPATTARHKHKYLVDTTAGMVSVTLPANPTPRTKVRFKDYARTFDIHPCRVLRNGKPILGIADDYDIDTKDAEREFEFIDETKGWVVK